MKEHTDIQKELESMGSLLAGLPRMMPYSVPQGYFEDTAKNIVNSIKEAEGYTISGDSKTMPYAGMPVGYFDQLPAKMLELAKAENTKKPRLIEIARKPKYTLAVNRVRWAAAAIFVIMVGIGSYTYFFRQNEAVADKMLSSVPNNELHEYLQNTCRIDVDRVVDNNFLINLQIDNKDIINYLDETGWDVVD